MSIFVTPGEKDLIEAFKSLGYEIILENLLVGDAHIRIDGKTVYIFERKAKGDLDASIKDGRYREQKQRLLQTNLALKNIVYIIEQLSASNNKTTHSRIWSAICNMQHRDGFTVYQTKNVTDTANYLIGMAKSVDKFPPFDEIKTIEKIEDAVDIQIKKKQVTPSDWFMYSLTLIPKCSLSIAKVIAAEYPTFLALQEILQEKGEHCLADFKHGASQRRIGNKLSADIYNIMTINYSEVDVDE